MSTTDLTIFTDDGFNTTLKIAETLLKSGVLPRGIDNPFKAFAIIQKGREIGVGPMRALTGINLIEGKPTVSPELKLEQFRQRGGHVKWVKSDNTIAHLHLKAANGDEHEEIVTLEDMKLAGVASKDNWRKYPKSMLRARATGFGLRALGEGDGSYTPDELGANTDEAGEYIPPPASKPKAEEYAPPSPKAPKGVSPEPTVESPSQAGPTSHGAAATKAPRADSIKHDGTFASAEQVKLLHILRGKVGGLVSCTDKKPCETGKWCAYHLQLRVFKDCDGDPVLTSKDLSDAQIMNLIGRYRAKIDQQGARAAEPIDIGAMPQGFSRSESSKLSAIEVADLRTKLMDQDFDEMQWCPELFGVDRLDQLDKAAGATALQLLLARMKGPDDYDYALEAAREKGLVPPR